MKHAFLITALAVVLAVCLTACGCRHEWAESTCTAPKTCSVCGAAEGEVLPHTPGAWMISESDYVNAENLLVRRCTGCDAILEEYTSAMDSLHNEWGFRLSAEDFAARLTAQLQQLQEGQGEYAVEMLNEDGKAQLNICYKEFAFRETAAELTFAVGGDELDYEEKDKEGSFLAVGGIAGGAEHLAVLMPAMIRAADPTMDIPGAFSLAGDWISRRSVECGGLVYEVAAASEAAIIFMIRAGS